MSLEQLAGSTYGPFPVRVSAERVAAYVAATGDHESRWVSHAPPTFAGALLFAAAPAFLHAEEVRPYTKLLVHADQTFEWHRALSVDEQVTVDGVLSRVRERGGAFFVTFQSAVRSGREPVIDATSTFLMGRGAPAQQAAEEPEPPVGDRGAHDPLPPPTGVARGPTASITRSASRLDLVRYAAASGDFNPVHFDHDTAVRAGFPGVLVHGLLMGAWLVQLASVYSSRVDGVAHAKLRFRNPLRPAAEARVSGIVEDVGEGSAKLRVALGDANTEYVDGRIRLRTA